MSAATLHTNHGPIELELFEGEAPKTVENFRKLAEDGFYDGVIFHRIIPDFMIQGGDPTGTGSGGPGYSFEDEFNDHPVVRGALAMANAGPNTNGSQFFIVTADATPWLDGKHTAFGQVTAGQDVVDAISGVDRDPGDRPQTPITMESVTVSEYRVGGATTVHTPFLRRPTAYCESAPRWAMACASVYSVLDGTGWNAFMYVNSASARSWRTMKASRKNLKGCLPLARLSLSRMPDSWSPTRLG